MKYFEVVDPYYSLIKAESVDKASYTYKELIGEDSVPFKIKEVDQMYAFKKFGTTKNEHNEELTFSEALSEFTDEENTVLLIDGSLI